MTGALLLTLLANGTAALPLPDRLDIPDSYSTVLCPTEAAAQRMLAEFHRVKPAPNNYTLDTDRFFQGLRETGCKQDSPRTGSITIRTAVARRDIAVAEGTETYLLYRGTMGAAAKPVIGIVDEGGANGASRTPLAEWKEARTKDGWLDARGTDPEQGIFYRCDTPAQANAVVAAMRGQTRLPWERFKTNLKQRAAAQGCRPARQSYFVTALRERVVNDCGAECSIELTALEAIDRSGLTVGLVFDASLM